MKNRNSLAYLLWVLLFLIFANSILEGSEDPPSLFCMGGGYLDAGCHHSGGLVEVEYKWGKYLFWHIRPQIGLATPELCSAMIYLGIGLDFHLTEHIVVFPNFSPGIYFQGKGRNLGCPLEFRSAFEIAYEFNNCVRLGFQYFHISNARIGNHNPGENAAVVFIGIPFCWP